MSVADRDPPILIDVALGTRRYDLMIGRGLLSELGVLVAARRPHAAVALVSDTVVASHHLSAAQAAVGEPHGSTTIHSAETHRRGYRHRIISLPRRRP